MTALKDTPVKTGRLPGSVVFCTFPTDLSTDVKLFRSGEPLAFDAWDTHTANRMAACWNACLGVETAHIETLIAHGCKAVTVTIEPPRTPSSIVEI